MSAPRVRLFSETNFASRSPKRFWRTGPELTAPAMPATSGEGGLYGGKQQPSKAATSVQPSANGADEPDEAEGIFMYEYNRWLTLEANWESAEATRHDYMEGSQFRKSRDERHRERGLERQSASIEQMKNAKGKVEQHREGNIQKGNVVRTDVAAWKKKVLTQQQDWHEHGRLLKEQIANLERSRPERDALLALKKRISAQVKVEVLQLADLSKQKKDEVLVSNREQAARIRAETSVDKTDGAKQFMYEQRKQTMLETQKREEDWAAERKAKRQEFADAAKKRRDKSQRIEASARLSRKELTEKKVKQAQELRERKATIAKAYRKQLEEHANLVKHVVNDQVAMKFAPTSASRRMMQHPHYQEVTAVLTDVTSAISKEIANRETSPRRRLPQPGSAKGSRPSSAPQLSSSARRK